MKTLIGKVVSAKMQKTVVVEVQNFVMHAKYKKYLKKSKRYLVHDETGTAREGDKVEISETRPMSKHKSFKIKA